MNDNTRTVTYTLDLMESERREIIIPQAPGFEWSLDLDQDSRLRFDQAFSQLDSAVGEVIDAYESPLSEMNTDIRHLSLRVNLTRNGVTEWEIHFNHDGTVVCRDDIHLSVSGTPPVWTTDTWEQGFEKFLIFLQDGARTEMQAIAQRLENLKALSFRAEPSSIPPKT
ncbi:hypothetical protein HZC53_02190 [Candidatus Uhrbacteria bacterium]|nr:hypothetical protein [Candidatus Uhrbacteria bacterium]